METYSIKSIRVNHDKTCEDMGKLLGITKQAYSYKENGRRKFTADELIMICTEFDIDCRKIRT